MRRLAVFLVLTFLFGFQLAQGEEVNNPFLSPIEVKSITASAGGENHSMSGSFILRNRSVGVVDNIGWKMTLQEEPDRKADGSWSSRPPAEFAQSAGDSLSLLAGEEKIVNFSISFSPFIKSSRYDLFVNVNDKTTGKILGGAAYNNILITGKGGMLDISKACGVTGAAQDNLKLECQLANPDAEAVTLHPVINIEGESQPQNPPAFVLGSKETKTLTFPLVLAQKPGDYHGSLRLFSDNNEALSNYAFFDYTIEPEQKTAVSSKSKSSLLIIFIIIILAIVAFLFRKKTIPKEKFLFLLLPLFFFFSAFNQVQATANSDGDTRVHTHIFHDDADASEGDPSRWRQSALRDVQVTNFAYNVSDEVFTFNVTFTQSNHNYSRMASVLKIGYVLKKANESGPYSSRPNPSSVDGSGSSASSFGGPAISYENGIGLWKIGGLSYGEKYSGDKNFSIYNLKVWVPGSYAADIANVRLFLDFRLVAIEAVPQSTGNENYESGNPNSLYLTARYFPAVSDDNQGASSGGFYFLKKQFDNEIQTNNQWFNDFFYGSGGVFGDTNLKRLFVSPWCSAYDSDGCNYVRKKRGIGKYTMPLVIGPLAASQDALLVSAGPVRVMPYNPSSIGSIKLNGLVSVPSTPTVPIQANWSCSGGTVSPASQTTTNGKAETTYTPPPGLTTVTKIRCDLTGTATVNGVTSSASAITAVIIEPPTNRITANGYNDSYFALYESSVALDWDTTGYYSCKVVKSSNNYSVPVKLTDVSTTDDLDPSRNGTQGAGGLNGSYNLARVRGSFVYGLACRKTSGVPFYIIDKVIVAVLDNNLAACSVSPTTEAAIGQGVTWSSSVGVKGNSSSIISGLESLNDLLYEWSGDENLSGDTKQVTKTYTSGGAKTAQVKISSVSQPVVYQAPLCPSIDIETLRATLTAVPSSGFSPLTSNLNASADGAASGNQYKYYFWDNCSDTGTDVTEVRQPTICGDPNNTVTRPANPGPDPDSATYSVTYTGDLNTIYKPKVIVERGQAFPVQAQADVTITPPTLTIVLNGPGKVTGPIGLVDGIDCGTNCNETYNGGATVVLTTIPSAGVSMFDRWSGDPDCSDGTVTMSANKTCTANFNRLPIAVINPASREVYDNDGTGAENVTLDGSSSSDPDGNIPITYKWEEGLSLLGSGSSISPGLSVGNHSIKLTVTDSKNAPSTPPAMATVNVYDNVPPRADAGSDQVVDDLDGDGAEPVTLDGSGSYDQNGGSIVDYEWSENGIPIGSGENPPPISFTTADSPHLVTLTVTDDGGDTDTDNLTIVVNSITPPTPSNWWDLFRTLWKEKK